MSTQTDVSTTLGPCMREILLTEKTVGATQESYQETWLPLYPSCKLKPSGLNQKHFHPTELSQLLQWSVKGNLVRRLFGKIWQKEWIACYIKQKADPQCWVPSSASLWQLFQLLRWEEHGQLWGSCDTEERLFSLWLQASGKQGKEKPVRFQYATFRNQ